MEHKYHFGECKNPGCEASVDIIENVAYATDGRTLTIEFVNGKKEHYQYTSPELLFLDIELIMDWLIYADTSQFD